MTNFKIDHELHELTVRYCFACKNYGSSSLQVFKDDIMALAPKLINRGVSPETLDSIYQGHVG